MTTTFHLPLIPLDFLGYAGSAVPTLAAVSPVGVPYGLADETEDELEEEEDDDLEDEDDDEEDVIVDEDDEDDDDDDDDEDDEEEEELEA